jgi:hypothetical protein
VVFYSGDAGSLGTTVNQAPNEVGSSRARICVRINPEVKSMKRESHSLEEALHLGEAFKKIDHARQQAAESLESAAATVRSAAAHGMEAIDTVAAGTASRLDSTATRVRNYDPVGTVRRAMRRPAVVACIGIAAGVLVGYSIRRSAAASPTS